MNDREVIESKRGKDGRFSETDFFDFNKSQQELILSEDFGLDKKEIKKLRTEKRRVKKLLELQENTDMTQFIEVDKEEEKPETKEEVPEKDIEELYTPKIKPELECPRCGYMMEITGAGNSGTDYKCNNCGRQITR